MTEQKYSYHVNMVWTGNLGNGTSGYQVYDRSYVVSSPGKPEIKGTSDPAFRGDPNCWNPEEMLLASLSACHMLWYLHLCSVSKVKVLSYKDDPKGEMVVGSSGSGHFEAVRLYPEIEITEESSLDIASTLHEEAHKKCFISNSVNFPISIFPTFKKCKPMKG